MNSKKNTDILINSQQFVEHTKMKYAKDLSAPLNISVEMTSLCNVKCIHCYNTRQIGSIQHNSLSKEKINHIIEQLMKNRILSVGITWWEPLIKKEEVLYLIEKCTNHGINTRLNTNLMLLTEEIADDLKKSQLKSILTSLTSYDEKTHDQITGRQWNFQKVIRWIQLALEKNIKVGVNMVLTQKNKDHVYKTGKFAHDLWVKGFFATKWSRPIHIPHFEKYSVDQEDVIKSLEDLIRIKEEFWMNVDVLECYPLCLLWEDEKFSIFTNHKCTAGVSSATIWPNWDVRSCNHASKVYGNIFSQELSDIWRQMKERRTGELLPEKCCCCDYLSKCTGGCRMEAESKGDIKGLDPFVKLENIHKIPNLLQKKQIKDINLLGKNISINRNTTFREERDFFLIDAGNGAIAISQDSWRFMKILLERKAFVIEDIAKEFSIDIDKLHSFLANLVRKGFIICS